MMKAGSFSSFRAAAELQDNEESVHPTQDQPSQADQIDLITKYKLLLASLKEVCSIAALAPHNDETEARAAFVRIVNVCKDTIDKTKP